MSILEREVVTTTAPPEVTTSDILHRAADLIEEFGWCQRTDAENEEGAAVSPLAGDAVRFCIAGAITRAANDFGRRTNGGSRGDVSDYGMAAKLLGCRNSSVAWMFNDADGRTRVDVVNALRRRAVRHA